MKKVGIIKQHGKAIAILMLCLSIPFVAIWYIASSVTKNIFYEQKSNNLMAFARILDFRLAPGGYNEILMNAGMENASREEQIAALNEALRDISDDVAHSTSGLGVGYYSSELDAILTYGPSADHQGTVGISIGEAHPGRRVMATGAAEVSMGTMVRGNIMNAMLPVVREGEVIGYIWSNNLVSELEQTLSQMSSIILLLLMLSYLLVLAVIVVFIRRMLLAEQKFMKALSKALDEAEAANHAKSAFLSTMSHEIRTPMNAILGFTEIQLQNESLDQDVRDGLEKIYASGDMLLGIINDILDMSKIEAGKLELGVSNYETASLISDTAQLNMMRIGSKPIEFELHVEEDLPVTLYGDELRIKQILNNLLSNAIKYTSEGTVKMSVSSKSVEGDDEKTMLTVCVSDTGQGMSKEQVDKLFDEYSRFNLEANRATEGTGLGMSITRNLIYMMNGDLSIESEPGIGSTFTVSLPQGKVDSAVLGVEIVEALHNFSSSSRAQMKRTQIIRDPMPYGKILIVDDVEANICVAKGLLTPYGLNIDSVNSGFAAIEKIKQGSEYDIVFMDHMMPEMDGVETTKIIRNLGYTHPIVALSANAVVGQADVFLKNGFDDFITKPIDVRQLNLILNKLIRDKQPPEVIAAAGAQAAESSKSFRYSGHKWRKSDKLERIKLPYARVLVVDDNATNLDVAKGLMKPYGMQIDTVTGGQQSIDAMNMENVRYNAIFMDHMMPGMDGIEALKKIRELGTDYAKNIPIIALTANAIVGSEKMFLSNGFQDFLSKPIDISRLDAVIRQWVQDKSQSESTEISDGGSSEPAVQDESCPKYRFSDYQIDGIDFEAGLDRFGGDDDSYFQVLRSFTANTKNLLGSIKEVRKEDLNDYAITVHGIKGSCRSICADFVGDIAESLEKAAKESDFEYVSEKAPALEQSVTKLLTDLDEMLAKLSAQAQRPRKAAPDKEVLIKILEACKIYDMQTVEAAIKELENYEYETNGELVHWLWENVQQFNVDEIIGKLSEM